MAKKAKKKAAKTTKIYSKPPIPAKGPKKAKRKKATKEPKGTCFVLMPFKDPFNMYYNLIIEPAVVKAELQPQKADSLFLPVPIMDDIWAMIQKATVLLAVLTGKNANVFYELGLGHAIGKPVVLVSETMDDVPFDLQPLRVILYDKDHPKWGEKLRANIIRALKATLSDPVEAVPPMFRKKVKSQAPEESETSLRLKFLERKVGLLEGEVYSEIPQKPYTDLLLAGCSSTFVEGLQKIKHSGTYYPNEIAKLVSYELISGISKQVISIGLLRLFPRTIAEEVMRSV